VELLVVIGIIAVLVGILLPALNRARGAAQAVACCSNVRQLATAAMLFAQDHHGHVPACTDTKLVVGPWGLNDLYKQNFSYRNNSGIDELQDWASALLRYMGDRSQIDFQQAPPDKTKVFQCPADPWMDNQQPGYRLFNDVTNSVSPFQAVSYGYNADIACLLNTTGIGRFNDNSTNISIYGGPPDSNGNGRPLECLIGRVYKSAETLLFADCGNRPEVAGGTPLDNNDILYYTTNGLTKLNAQPLGKTWPGSLQAVANKVNLGNRIPYNRHRKRISIAFCDGHAETIGSDEFYRVRVSPYR
jgi:prepilin-type processing-associated H-X9-DG protein